MRYILFLILLSCFSCNNERVLQLPEIENAEITEVLDVSPAYIFYDETQPDSSLLNRKNLISTTNWLVNVDKRLTLRQAIPHIKFLQDKKRNAELHKNENAKNYFTCNDMSIGNLGFMEFTDVYYKFSEPEKASIRLLKANPTDSPENNSDKDDFIEIALRIDRSNKMSFESEIMSSLELLEASASLSENRTAKGISIQLGFDKTLSFEDYIAIKSKLAKLNNDKIRIDPNEFIY
jgi:biopolymer transport protein ExbD